MCKSDTVEKMATKPSFIIIKLDRSLLPRLSVLAHHKTCDHCIAFHQNGLVMPILPDVESVEDVMCTIKAKYRIDVAIKLSKEGVFFPPQLPIEILAKFEGNVFRVSPLRKQKFGVEGGCAVRQSPLCQASINVDAVTEASQGNVVTTGASSDWETFTSNLEDEEDSGTSDMDADGSEESESSGEPDDGEESAGDDGHLTQRELEEEDDSPDYDPSVPHEDVDIDEESSSNGDSSDSDVEQSIADVTDKQDNQDKESENKQNEQTRGGEYTETGGDDKSAEEQSNAPEITDLKDPRYEELQDFNFSSKMSLQTSESGISIMNEGAIEESLKLQSLMPNASSNEAQQFSSAHITSCDSFKWSIDSKDISAVPGKKNGSVAEAGNLSTLDTSVEVEVELILGDKPLMTSTPNDLVYAAQNILSKSPEIFQAPVKRPKLKRQLPSVTSHEEISHSKRTKHSSIIDLGKSLMRSFAENLCDLASSNSYASVSNLQRRASGPATPHPKAIVWPDRCPTSDDESQNPENWIPVASKTAADIPPGSCIKFKLRKENMEEIALQVESITDENIIGYSLQDGNDAVSYGPKSRTKRMLSFQKDSMEDVFILSRARAFGIDLSNMSFNFD